MHYKIISQADLKLVTLDEAKMQCRIMASNTMDDNELNLLISSCSELAQVYCNRLMTQGNVTQLVEQYQSEFYLWGGDVTEVVSVTATDSSGESVTIDDFTFNPVSEKLKLPHGYAHYTDFTITHKCGFMVTPAKVKQGVLLMISTLFNNHDDYVTGLTVDSVPLTSLKLLDSVKHYVT